MSIQQYKKYKTGFSLIELMIVIAIIAILITIAAPSYKNYTRRAHYTEIVQAAAPYKLGIEQCFQLNGDLSHCQANRNGVPPNLLENEGYGLIDHITITENGIINIVPRDQFGITAADNYELTPEIQQNAIHWKISGGSVEKGYANS